MKKISVIIPVYKSEPFLVRCVESVLEQTYRNLEVLLVDDGSPDNCPALCDAFARQDGRVRVIHQKNAGVSAARNAGLEVASGEYVALVDSDDYIERDMYQIMMETAARYDCDVVMCDCVKEFSDRKESYTHPIRPGYYDARQLKEEYYPHLLMMENMEYPPTISNWLCLFKRVLGADAPLRYAEGIRFSEDLLFGAQLMRRAASFYYLRGRDLYHYNCENMDSATHTAAPDKWQDYLRLHRRIREAFSRDAAFDFSGQIDACLLFFVYNAIGDIYKAPDGSWEKYKAIQDILKASAVREMFTRLSPGDLSVSWRQKILTWCYAHRRGLRFWIWYYEKKGSI